MFENVFFIRLPLNLILDILLVSLTHICERSWLKPSIRKRARRGWRGRGRDQVVALRTCPACKSAPCHLLHGHARRSPFKWKKRTPRNPRARARATELRFQGRGILRTGTAGRVLILLGPRRFRDSCRLLSMHGDCTDRCTWHHRQSLARFGHFQVNCRVALLIHGTAATYFACRHTGNVSYRGPFFSKLPRTPGPKCWRRADIRPDGGIAVIRVCPTSRGQIPPTILTIRSDLTDNDESDIPTTLVAHEISRAAPCWCPNLAKFQRTFCIWRQMHLRHFYNFIVRLFRTRHDRTSAMYDRVDRSDIRLKRSPVTQSDTCPRARIHFRREKTHSQIELRLHLRHFFNRTVRHFHRDATDADYDKSV